MPETKAAILQKRIEDIIYNLDIRTNADNVFVGTTGKTLTEYFLLYPTADEMAQAINQALMDFIGDAPEALDTWIELVRWIQEHEDLYEALILELANKVDIVEGKGLSTNDFTDELLKRLINLENYDDTELRNKITEHVNDLGIHIKPPERTKWDSYEEILESLSAKITNLENVDLEIRKKIDGHISNLGIHVDPTDKTRWDNYESILFSHDARILTLESIELINDLLTTIAGKGALDARQGKILDEKISMLNTSAALAIAATQEVAQQAKALALAAQDSADGKLPILGNAITSSKWLNNIELLWTGDISGSMSVNGSKNMSAILSLIDTGIIAGTYKSVTVDSKGRVISGSNPNTLLEFGIIDAYTAIQIDGKILIINEKISEVEAIARGASRAIVFNTLADLNTWLTIVSNVTTLRIGDNFFIRDTGVPDFWWDGTQKQPLETEKVDLSNIYTKAEIATLLAAKEPIILAGTSSQYWNGSKIWTDFAASVRSSVLAGLSIATKTTVLATDSVLTAIGKLQAQISEEIITAMTRGESENKNLAYGDKFFVLQATVDSRGRITGLNARTMTLPDAPITIEGNALTASKWANTRILSFTGDGMASFSVDGSADVSAELILKNIITAATQGETTNRELSYGSTFITLQLSIDSKGRITAINARTMTMPAAPTNISGNAGSASIWANARILSWTGDVTGSMSVNGSQNVSAALTLANSGVTAGSYGPVAITLGFGGTIIIPYITVDAKGRVTGLATRNVILPAAPTAVTGNAGTANKWLAKMIINLIGDAIGSGSFDGSETTNIALTLSNSGVTAGTYKSVTVDVKGRVTAGTNPTTLAGFGIVDSYTAIQVDGKILLVNEKISEIETIAKGASRAIVFDTLIALNAWLAIAANVATLRIGDNLFIRELNVPDFWWDGTQKQPLETEKVDLSNIYTKAEIATLLATKEPLISAGTTSQYWNGSKAWTDFATSVRAAILTGLSLTTTTAVAAADSILIAIGKLQAQISASSGVTAATLGETADRTLAFGAEFLALQMQVDARGRVLALYARKMIMPAAPANITGTAGNVTGIVAIANGGTGQTTAAAARNALGLGNTTGALPVANGGTGATTAAVARANLGALGESDIVKSAVTVKISSGIISATAGVSVGLTSVTRRGTKFTIGTSTISVSGVEHIEVSGIFLFTDTLPATTKEITIAFMTGTVETHSIVMPVNTIVPPITLDVSTVDTIKIYTNAAWSGITMDSENVLTVKEI